MDEIGVEAPLISRGGEMWGRQKGGRMLGSHKMMEAHLAWEKPHGTVSLSFSDTDDMSSFPHLWNEVYRLLLSTPEQLLQTSLQLPLFLTLLCTGWLPWDPVSLSWGPSH